MLHFPLVGWGKELTEVNTGRMVSCPTWCPRLSQACSEAEKLGDAALWCGGRKIDGELVGFL